jgi:hypothetical protein
MVRAFSSWIMKTPYLLASVVMACCSASLFAQSPAPVEKPVPPPGPLIQKRAPDFARWVTRAKISMPKPPEKTSAAATGSPASDDEEIVTVTKTGAVVHVERTDEQRKTWQTWCRGTVQIAVTPGSQIYLVAAPPNKDVVNPLYFDFSNSDFEGFEWISAQNYTGIKPVLGKNCLTFKDDRRVTGTLAPAPVSNALVACIDLETRLPVALMNDNGIVTYQFLKPPEAMQDLPANVQAVLDKQKQDIQSVKRKPSLPY